jgi:hypothetical protein
MIALVTALLAAAVAVDPGRFDLICSGTEDLYNPRALIEAHHKFEWRLSIDINKKVVVLRDPEDEQRPPQDLAVAEAELVFGARHINRVTGEMTKHTESGRVLKFREGQLRQGALHPDTGQKVLGEVSPISVDGDFSPSRLIFVERRSPVPTPTPTAAEITAAIQASTRITPSSPSAGPRISPASWLNVAMALRPANT